MFNTDQPLGKAGLCKIRGKKMSPDSIESIINEFLASFWPIISM